MRKPRKSTLDAFIDQFAEFPIESQERALDLMNFEHRRAQIRAKKQKPAENPADPPAGEVDGAAKLDLWEPA